MSWKEEVEGIEERRRQALRMGGDEGVARQRAQGRGTVRERIDALLDPESFREQGPIAGFSERDADGRLAFTPANYVLGMGRIDGRWVVVGGEDFTLRGGSPSPAGLRKSVFSEDLALRMRAPLVRLLEGGGGSVPRPGAGGSSGPPPPPDPGNGPPRFLSIARALGAVPVVSAALGPVAGFPAARLAASHYSVMVRRTSQVLVAGPALVERALRVKASKEELGGADVHLRSGVVDAAADDEAAAMAALRRFLGYLPSHVWERAPRSRAFEEPSPEAVEALLHIIPRSRRQPYKMRRLLEGVLDRDSFTELGASYGASQITGLARIAGQPVGVLASDPYYYAGSMTADGAQKLRRFVELCDTFHLPVLSFVDEPGFMLGPDAERQATIRHGMAAISAVMQSSVPWISILVRKVYGVAGAAHFGPEALRLAWPSAEVGALPLEGGVAVAYRRQLAEAEDPEKLRREIEERLEASRSPYGLGEAFGVHDLIDPRETRTRLCDWVEWIQPQLNQHLGPRSYTMRGG